MDNLSDQEKADKLAADKKAVEEAEAKVTADKEAAEKVRLAGLTQEQRDTERIEKLASEKSAAELKNIKENLDKAYAARDAAKAEAETLAKEKREAELKRLDDEGKHKEAAELRIKERDERIKTLEEQNTVLSRDGAVRDALKGYEFRSAKAADIAFREIVSDLVKNDKNEWVHKSGMSIVDAVTAFASNEEQSFLFKPKSSSGGGSSDGSGNTHQGKPNLNDGKSLFGMSQADVLKMAEKGSLPGQKAALPF